jgi:translation initiation factor IF-2
MSAENNKVIRLKQVAKELNVGIHTIVEYLGKKGKKIDENPNTKIDSDMYDLLSKVFQGEKKLKEASKITKKTTKPVEIVLDATEVVKKEKEERKEEEVPTNEIVIRDVTLGKENKKEKVADKKEKVVEKIVEQKVEEKVEAKKQEIKIEEKTQQEQEQKEEETTTVGGLNILGKIDLGSLNQKTKPTKKKKEKKKEKKEEKPQKPVSTDKKQEKKEEKKQEAKQEPKTEVKVEKKEKVAPAPEFISTSYVKLSGPVLTGEKVDLSQFQKPKKQQPVASSSKGKIENKEKQDKEKDKKKRKRIKPAPAQAQQSANPAQPAPKKENKKHKPAKKEVKKVELDSNEIEKQIKETLARLSPMGKSKTSKHRRDKRQSISQHMQEEMLHEMEEQKVLKVTEFVTANELANMMDVPVTKIIASCMSLGMFVSINQRLDAEAIQLIADEFGYSIKFVSADVVEALNEEEVEDREEDLQPRSPIVTVMGHVDHGKTSLLDYIRNANVIAGEAGGITQHIGAYEVQLPESGKKITFLDTPGHEAFTAMRARGAKMTDIAIIVIACDDKIMPQTVEAINHAQAAGVPIVFALNKIDRPAADPDRIKSELANMNLLVEDWGGKIQSQEISAKKGTNVDLLLEKVLLEAEMLELKGNPNKRAKGTVIESSLDKGRGYVAKILVQDGTIRQGDVVLAGATYGRVKAMYNERNKLLKEAGPSAPVLLLGLNGAPQAGDTFNVMQSEKDAKDLSNKRTQLQREQGLRTQKHITLDEIGRRIAIGDFKQLDLIVKADVDGSVEALSDSLLKLSTPEVQVNVIHKSVGQITESDVLLATASNAIIIGFQVRPSVGARKLAEQEQIDIRLYSIIYTAINELKDAIEGMLSPEIQEKIVANLEVRETFKISKVGTIAGCMCLDGKIARSTKVRIIRDGIVVYTGKLASLKRFKDDVKEVVMGQDCGLNIENFNDIKVGDIIEGYEELEIKRTLK